MNLDKILSTKIASTPKRIRKPRERKDKRINGIRVDAIQQAINLIKTGDYDPKLKFHRMVMGMAHEAGFIDKNKLIILKELPSNGRKRRAGSEYAAKSRASDSDGG